MNEKVNLWKPEYMLDIDIIDEQHKGFFDLCLKSAMVCESARNKPVKLSDVIRLIYDMRGYAFRHFFTEEALLLKYAYPKIYGHMSQHDIFLRTLQEFTAELHVELAKAEKAGPEGFLACANHINGYLTTWWGEHILNTDQDYARFMRGQKGHAAKD
ncbi:MAG: hemerythrin family protein [Proteobacteria bacterium]|nr:hemerythrin family protein [Pseudomonadota bacterium]